MKRKREFKGVRKIKYIPSSEEILRKKDIFVMEKRRSRRGLCNKLDCTKGLLRFLGNIDIIYESGRGYIEIPGAWSSRTRPDYQYLVLKNAIFLEKSYPWMVVNISHPSGKSFVDEGNSKLEKFLDPTPEPVSYHGGKYALRNIEILAPKGDVYSWITQDQFSLIGSDVTLKHYADFPDGVRSYYFERELEKPMPMTMDFSWLFVFGIKEFSNKKREAQAYIESLDMNINGGTTRVNPKTSEIVEIELIDQGYRKVQKEKVVKKFPFPFEPRDKKISLFYFDMYNNLSGNIEALKASQTGAGSLIPTSFYNSRFFYYTHKKEMIDPTTKRVHMHSPSIDFMILFSKDSLIPIFVNLRLGLKLWNLEDFKANGSSNMHAYSLRTFENHLRQPSLKGIRTGLNLFDWLNCKPDVEVGFIASGYGSESITTKPFHLKITSFIRYNQESSPNYGKLYLGFEGRDWDDAKMNLNEGKLGYNPISIIDGKEYLELDFVGVLKPKIHEDSLPKPVRLFLDLAKNGFLPQLTKTFEYSNKDLVYEKTDNELRMLPLDSSLKPAIKLNGKPYETIIEQIYQKYR